MKQIEPPNRSNAAPLAGMVITSPDPERLSSFYQATLGIPFVLQRHGNMPEHFECDVAGIHFAILKKTTTVPSGTITPSFLVSNIRAMLETTGIAPLHPVLELGNGKRICTIADPDGNAVRLFEIDKSASPK